VIVHHVEVDEVGTCGKHGIDLSAEASEVCGENGWRDPGRAMSINHGLSP
jgi:hypothetical protein